jgi:predicted methyltransferase
MMMVVLSHYQAKQTMDAHHLGKGLVSVSLNLGVSTSQLTVVEHGLLLPDGSMLEWGAVEKIAESTSSCYIIEDGIPRAIQFYSEETDRVYSLYPTQGAPTMLVSGIPMHRIKGSNPYQDTLTKIRAIAPTSGRVLDTATGLGYTACQASRSARRVITIELDPAVLAIARLNPWSQELFESPKIEQLLGDSFEVVNGFRDEAFDCIIHDPPQFSLAGELYSGEFYSQLFRVLSRGGKLFHYIGDPASKSSGSVTRSVVRRLKEAGFRDVTPHPEAFGVVVVR